MSHETLEEISDEEWEYTFATNVSAMFYLCKAALPHMEPGSSIIGSSSVNSDMPSPDLAPYAATKAAIANFCASLAQMLGERGIRVNSVAPGPIWTPLIPATMPPEKVEHFGKDTPLGPAGPAGRAGRRSTSCWRPTRAATSPAPGSPSPAAGRSCDRAACPAGHGVRAPTSDYERTTMKAVTWQGRRDVRVEEVPDPRIEKPNDAIVKITSSGLCGSDLHLYETLKPVHGTGRRPGPRADGRRRGGRRRRPAT